MDALKIALETIIVGALALPWMALLVDLFYPAKERPLGDLLPKLDGLNSNTVSAIGGVFLFAMAYLVGSSVTRVAEDFFNDDDLAIKVTEDGIRSAVYCKPSEPWLMQTGVVLTNENGVRLDGATLCAEPADDRVKQAFGAAESALFIAGL